MFSPARQGLRFGLLLVTVFTLFAQDDPPAGPARPGARRPGRGAQGTREFLGLGNAPDTAAAAKGDSVYKQNCGTCHGQTGRGGQAPSLVRSVMVLHDEKGEEIGPVILKGRPQAGMPAFTGLSADDIYNVSQYLHLQVELAANRGTYGSTYSALRTQTSGDPKRGETFFNGAGGCGSCHSVSKDLAKIGTKFPQAAMMQARFLWPASQNPPKVTITLPSGESVAGSVRTQTDFDISITDSAGQYRYFQRGGGKDAVKVDVEDKLAGHRALLPRYTDANIHDLAAYLVTLK